MKLFLIILLLIPNLALADFRAHEKPETENEIAIFHDPTSAKHWAQEMDGKVIVAKDNTYIVLYKETVWVSTPNDWKE